MERGSNREFRSSDSSILRSCGPVISDRVPRVKRSLDLSFSQKERNVLLNPTSQLLKFSNLSHCAHYVDHLKQFVTNSR